MACFTLTLNRVSRVDLLSPISSANLIGVSEEGLRDQVLRVLNHVNDFNVPLCQLKLRAVLATASQSSFEAANTLVTIVIEKSKAPANAFTDMWAALISGLPPKQALQVSPVFIRFSMTTFNIDSDSSTSRE